MNRFLMVLIFALCAALANAGFVNQDLEARLLSIENRLSALEDRPQFKNNWGTINSTPLPVYQYNDCQNRLWGGGHVGEPRMIEKGVSK